MTNDISHKSLKDQNRWQLWLTIALNTVAFYAVAQSEAIAKTGLHGLLTAVSNLFPIGFAFILTSIVNGLLSAAIKARLVFLRWTHALPGHRVFSKYAPSDPRIDLNRLKKALGNKLPEGPDAENQAWYRIFKEVEAAPEIQHIHREFLFMRDYTCIAALCFVGYGITALIIVEPMKAAMLYVLALLLQVIVVRHVAATYGERFVCTVLAVKSAGTVGGAGKR